MFDPINVWWYIFLCVLVVVSVMLTRANGRVKARFDDDDDFYEARSELEKRLNKGKPVGPPNREVREITNLEMEARHERWRERDRGYITKTTTTTTDYK